MKKQQGSRLRMKEEWKEMVGDAAGVIEGLTVWDRLSVSFS